MKGLTNLGNTCYLNAALQCLVHVPGLTNYVLSGWAEKDLSKKRINACALATAYAAMTKQYWGAPEPGVVDPRPVWTALAKLHKPFANAKPHDAHEALVLLLKHLHDALARTPRIDPSLAYQRVDREAWDAHVEAEGYSILTELVRGQMRCTVAAGAYRSDTYEHFVGLTLDGPGVDPAACLRPTTIPDFVASPGAAPTVATQTKRLVYAPLVLVLHLTRPRDNRAATQAGPTTAAPTGTPTTVAPTTAVPFSVVLGPDAYELFAACLLADGHYTAVCEAGGTWRHMDDDAVSEVDPATVARMLADRAYVLLYKKRL